MTETSTHEQTQETPEPSTRPAYIHHVNFPTTDIDRTKEWYAKVFGMKGIVPKSNTKVLLMTRGDFDLHFTPVETMDRMAPYHFAVEIEDWDGFMDHLAGLGVRHTRITARPENNSLFCYVHDPDHTMIELVFHGNRPGGAPAVVKHGQGSKSPRSADAGAADSAEVARDQLDAMAEGKA